MKINFARTLILVLFFCFFKSMQVFSQDWEGRYFGSLISENNLIIIDRVNNQYIIELFNSEKEFFKMDGIEEGEKLRFDLPFLGGDDLKVSISPSLDGGLLLFFTLEGKNYETPFTKVDLNRKNPAKQFFHQSEISNKLDENIIGKWSRLFSISPDSTIDYEFQGFVTEYLENGYRKIDYKKILMRNAKEAGISIIEFKDFKFPEEKWFTQGHTLILQNGQFGEERFLYKIKGDTLITQSNKGGTQFFYIKLQ